MSPRAQALVAPALAQVNLLPPEVRSARGLARLKRVLGAVTVLAIVAAGGLVGLSIRAQQNAETELAARQADTQDLLDEQKKYAEVPIVLGQLDRITTARLVGMSTEILWRPYLMAIGATMPEGLLIDNLVVTGATPMELPAGPAGALEAPSIATVSFTANSLTVPDTAAWMDGLEQIPGFADPWFTAAVLSEVDGLPYYTVTATVQIDLDAYALRFVETGDEG